VRRDNSIGKVAKIALFLWSCFWLYFCGAEFLATAEDARRTEDGRATARQASQMTMAWMLYGGIWLAGAAGFGLLYAVLGRSDAPEEGA